MTMDRQEIADGEVQTWWTRGIEQRHADPYLRG